MASDLDEAHRVLAANPELVARLKYMATVPEDVRRAILAELPERDVEVLLAAYEALKGDPSA